VKKFAHYVRRKQLGIYMLVPEQKMSLRDESRRILGAVESGGKRLL
jgi:hypothetical protein